MEAFGNNFKFMIRFKDINIPNPCSVDYDSLPYDEVKRFCGSCKKHVYDFRGKNEAYLNEVFRQTGKVCGIYYEDQIQKPSLKIQRPFYYAFVTKVISIGLLLKILFTSNNTQALTHKNYPIVQITNDSTGIEVKDKNKRNRKRHPYTLTIFINKKLYRSDIYDEGSFIYLPDSIKPEDKIKVIVKRDGSGRKWTNEIVKNKVYNFRYMNAQEILIKITYKKELRLFKRRSRAGGIMVDW